MSNKTHCKTTGSYLVINKLSDLSWVTGFTGSTADPDRVSKH